MTTISTGCNNCTYLKGKHCKLWQITVKQPDDSHCESWRLVESPETKQALNNILGRIIKEAK